MIKVQRRWLLGGGIGSGKSAVRVLLEQSGLATIDADSIGHEILEPGGVAFEQVGRRWPQVVDAGKIDRGSLGQIVFADPLELSALEEITHPHIFDTIRGQVEEVSGAVVVELPLISTSFDNEWKVMVVDVDDAERMKRLSERGMPADDAANRIASQLSRTAWLAEADLVIPNHGSLADLEETVNRVSAVMGLR